MESIKSIITKVSGDPIILIISLVILGVVVYTVTKKLFKIAILVFLFIGIYLGYIALTEGSVAVEEVIDRSIETGKGIGNDIFESTNLDDINID
tara:strand:+ start:806 stop:1087 length:282 start_codon:yes stop_codon:yes gene_type:complete